jgi:small subunit ribosomal protein S10
MEKLRLKLRAYDNRVLDKSVSAIIDAVKRTGSELIGPIPLPTKIRKYTVLRSPHINKDSREQFEQRTHKRLIDIIAPTPKTVDALQRLEMPAGVYIDIKMKNK